MRANSWLFANSLPQKKLSHLIIWVISDGAHHNNRGNRAQMMRKCALKTK